MILNKSWFFILLFIFGCTKKRLYNQNDTSKVIPYPILNKNLTYNKEFKDNIRFINYPVHGIILDKSISTNQNYYVSDIAKDLNQKLLSVNSGTFVITSPSGFGKKVTLAQIDIDKIGQDRTIFLVEVRTLEEFKNTIDYIMQLTELTTKSEITIEDLRVYAEVLSDINLAFVRFGAKIKTDFKVSKKKSEFDSLIEGIENDKLKNLLKDPRYMDVHLNNIKMGYLQKNYNKKPIIIFNFNTFLSKNIIDKMKINESDDLNIKNINNELYKINFDSNLNSFYKIIPVFYINYFNDLKKDKSWLINNHATKYYILGLKDSKIKDSVMKNAVYSNFLRGCEEYKANIRDKKILKCNKLQINNKTIDLYEQFMQNAETEEIKELEKNDQANESNIDKIKKKYQTYKKCITEQNSFIKIQNKQNFSVFLSHPSSLFSICNHIIKTQACNFDFYKGYGAENNLFEYELINFVHLSGEEIDEVAEYLYKIYMNQITEPNLKYEKILERIGIEEGYKLINHNFTAYLIAKHLFNLTKDLGNKFIFKDKKIIFKDKIFDVPVFDFITFGEIKFHYLNLKNNY